MTAPADTLFCARVVAGDIEVGDSVARSRSLPFLQVMRVEPLVVTVRLHFEDGSMDWPRREACWWRELRSGTDQPVEKTLAFAGAADGERGGPSASETSR